MAVDFSGSWKLYEQENAEEFLRAVSAPELYIRMVQEVRPVTVIRQQGQEFSISVQTALRSNTNTFRIDTESEFTTLDGQKITATARLIDKKIVIESEKFTHVRELRDGEMLETLTAGNTTFIRRSRRI